MYIRFLEQLIMDVRVIILYIYKSIFIIFIILVRVLTVFFFFLYSVAAGPVQ